jgi:hypothetical protein
MVPLVHDLIASATRQNQFEKTKPICRVALIEVKHKVERLESDVVDSAMQNRRYSDFRVRRMRE